MYALQEVARVADRKDPFARRIFNTALYDNRMRMNLQDFRLSRAYFFGTFIRAGRNNDDSLRMYPCLMLNHAGKTCSSFSAAATCAARVCIWDESALSLRCDMRLSRRVSSHERTSERRASKPTERMPVRSLASP